VRPALLTAADEALLRREGFTPLPTGLWFDSAAGYALRPLLALERARADAGLRTSSNLSPNSIAQES
jgi:hypothetical protein